MPDRIGCRGHRRNNAASAARCEAERRKEDQDLHKPKTVPQIRLFVAIRHARLAHLSATIEGMSVINILVALIVLGVLLYLVGLIPMDPTVAKVIRVVAILLVVLWVLDAVFGLGLGHLGSVRIGR